MAYVTAPNLYNAFLAKGYSPSGAAAITGNLMWESGGGQINNNTGDAGSAYGLGQWRLGRRTELFNLYGSSPTLQNQVDFTTMELQRDYPQLNSQLMQGGSVTELTRSFMDTFERPSAKYANLQGRVDWAGKVSNGGSPDAIAQTQTSDQLSKYDVSGYQVPGNTGQGSDGISSPYGFSNAAVSGGGVPGLSNAGSGAFGLGGIVGQPVNVVGDLPKAVRDAGKEQAGAITKATDTQTKSDQKIAQQQQTLTERVVTWLGDTVVRISMVLLALVFIFVGLYMFVPQMREPIRQMPGGSAVRKVARRLQ